MALVTQLTRVRCAPAAPVGGGPAFGIDREGDRARSPAKNLHSTTTSRQMARPVELYMKSMVSAAGLGSGAGVGAPCRFSGAPGSRDRIHPLRAAVYRVDRRPLVLSGWRLSAALIGGRPGIRQR